MNKINAVIIDDEHKGRELIKTLLGQFCKEVNVIGMADSVQHGFEQITALRPDLVFLDIEMTDGSGFDLLGKFDTINFAVIFVTAFDKYAIRAIKFSAIDYLLKPVDETELVNAVRKIKKVDAPEQHQNMQQVAANYRNLAAANNKLAISTQNGLVLVEISEIIRCRAHGNYTSVFLTGNREIMATKNLGEFEGFLKDYNFIRVHHAHLINADCIRSYQRGRGGTVLMTDGAEIDVSQRKKNDFLNHLNKI